MIEGKDWRSTDFVGLFDRYDRADFAQEFLGRCPEYRQYYGDTDTDELNARADLSVGANQWGCFLAFNPDLPSSQTPALWSPQATALTVILDAAPSGFAALTLPDIERAVSIEIDISNADGRHLVVGANGTRHRLWIKSDRPQESLSYHLIGDAHFDTRKAAAERFYERLTGRTSSRPSSRLHPGPSERWRLIQWLRLLDALGQGASARELAATLIGQDAYRISAAEWDISPERKRIARWTEKAVAMRDGGFRELLLGH